MSTLHIVDGDCTGGTLKQAGLEGHNEILSWRDALYTGPVPAALSLRQLSRVRSHFWSSGKRSNELYERDRVLAKQGKHDQIALWFGAGCVLCELSLVQVLSWFREQNVPSKKLSWIAVHGGELRPEQIPQVYASRRAVRRGQMALAERTWRAFRQTSPSALNRLVRGDARILPGLLPAVSLLLQEYPSRRNGLSRLESKLLREIHRRGTTKAMAAVAAILATDSVGDLLLLDMLRKFVEAPNPLLEFAEPLGGKVDEELRKGTIRLTTTGRRVLAGRADAITLNGIDRWIGGVHLKGQSVPWRWDKKIQQVARVTA